MGVTGLWKLIEPCGKPVPVETLEGKVIAVDISIWLHQAVKGFQDSKGSALAHAHLLGLFHRLCKLLYYRIKPIFVFDGSIPQLKRDTILRRQQQRSKLNSEADRIQALLLQSLAKEKVIQQALGAEGAAELLLKSPNAKGPQKNAAREDTDDMFKLPELPSTSANKKDTDLECESDFNESSFTGNEEMSSESETEGSSFDESNARYAYNVNLQAIDVRSKHFLNLPADVRHEILVDIKETRKQSSWGRIQELPSRSDDFSTFQMRRLLKRRAVQESLEEAEQEMGGRTLTYAELQNYFTEEGILGVEQIKQGTKQISSDEHTRFLLVRDLKKQLSKVAEADGEAEEEDIKAEEGSSDKKEKSPSIPLIEIKESRISVEQDAVEVVNDKLGEEYEDELQMAIALSLEQSTVYKEADYAYESNEQLRLNRNQRKTLKDAAMGPARSYMIEYGGMNGEEVEGLMENTQVREDGFESFLEAEEYKTIGKMDKEGKKEEGTHSEEDKVKESSSELEKIDSKAVQTCVESEEICLRVSDESSEDNDSDFEEVPETESLHSDVEKVVSEDILEKMKSSQKSLEIKIDLQKGFSQDDDLFADVFADISDGEETVNQTQKVLEEAGSKEAKDSPIKAAPSTATQICLPSTSRVSKAATLDILADLEKQLQDVKDLKLEDIKLSNSQGPIVEISDDESGKEPQESAARMELKKEVIEICDSDDAQALSPRGDCLLATPTKPKSSPSLSSKSPNLKTPTKNHTISEYFQTNYVIKRTPESSKKEEEEIVPKVKSPFFVRKTPKSRQKKDEDNSPSGTPSKSSKATKTLFSEKDGQETDVFDLESEIMPLEPTPETTEDLIKEAAEALKTNKTEEELQTIASDLAKERRELEAERNRQDRMGMSVTQRMSSECQELLRLFGIPYIVAPMEAEAQCAFLDSIDLTNGTITDDSDIWLFGGRTVYKNFFAQSKHVLEFRAEKIETTFSCDRKKLIQLACLVGSDYTTGILGIGAVTALEILASFSSGTPSKVAYHSSASESETKAILDTLCRFRDWWLTYKSSTTPVGSSARLALKKKLKNIELYEGFPNSAVIEAYWLPKVDENRDPFTWGEPDVESIIEYTRKNFGWTRTKTTEILTPVLKRIGDKKSQKSIKNYFTVSSALASPRQPKVSKRVQKAIDKMSGKIEEETPEKPVKARQRRKRKPAGEEEAGDNETKASEAMDTKALDENEKLNEENKNEIVIGAKKPRKTRKKQEKEEENDSEAGTSKSLLNAKPEEASRKRAPRIPDPHPAIPQREKDKQQIEMNRAKAVEIFKKTNEEKEAKKKRRN